MDGGLNHPGKCGTQQASTHFRKSVDSTGSSSQNIYKEFGTSECSSDIILERKKLRIPVKVLLLTAVLLLLSSITISSLLISMQALRAAETSVPSTTETEKKNTSDDTSVNHQTYLDFEQKVVVLQKLYENLASKISAVNDTVLNNTRDAALVEREVKSTIQDLSQKTADISASLNDKLNGIQKSFDALDRRTSIRLDGGKSLSEGRVEILHNGLWGTICDHFWDIKDANVTCHMLGFSKAARAYRGSWFGGGVGKPWLDLVECNGRESDLSECSHAGWGTIGLDCDLHRWDAGVSCS